MKNGVFWCSCTDHHRLTRGCSLSTPNHYEITEFLLIRIAKFGSRLIGNVTAVYWLLLATIVGILLDLNGGLADLFADLYPGNNPAYSVSNTKHHTLSFWPVAQSVERVGPNPRDAYSAYARPPFSPSITKSISIKGHEYGRQIPA